MDPKPTPPAESEEQNSASNATTPSEQTPVAPGNFETVVIKPTVHGAGLSPITSPEQSDTPTPTDTAAPPAGTSATEAADADTDPAAAGAPAEDASTTQPASQTSQPDSTPEPKPPQSATTQADVPSLEPSSTPDSAPDTKPDAASPVESSAVSSPTADTTPDTAPAPTPGSAASQTPDATPSTTSNPTVAPASNSTPPVIQTTESGVEQTPQPAAAVAETNPTSTPSIVVATAAVDVPSAPKPRRKLLLLSIVGGLLTLGLAAGAVFGLYLPNTPDNVWSTGLNRTGKALESIVTSATETNKLESYKTSEISGNFTAKYDDQAYSGTLTSAFDDADSDSSLTIATKDKSGKTTDLKLQARTNIATGSNFPDIYLRIAGLKSLGLDAFVPNISSYDSKWIEIDAKYLESIGATYLSGTDNNQKEITSADIAELARSATSVTTDYLLTTDESKAVFTKESFVGKETVDGVKTYHYTVSVNKDHAEAYCVALSNAMLSSNAYKKVAEPKDDELARAKADAAKECKTTVNETFKATDTFDLWIDSKYKLVYKVRIYDKKDKGTYTDVGQLYKGDDKLSLFAAWHDTKAKSDSKFTVDTDLKTNATTGTFTAKSDNKDYPYELTATIKATLSSKDVKFTKPSPTVPIQDILAALGYPASPTAASPTATTTAATTSSSATDTERKADLGSIQSNVETYYAQYGSYPNLTDLNSSTWRSKNTPTLKPSALTDPKGTTPTLVETATATQYGYRPTCNATKTSCTSYVLTAKLSDGTIYSKKSL